MKLLIATNVVLDLLIARQPFVEHAASLVARIERGEATGYLCATTVTTIHYLLVKAVGTVKARNELQKLLGLFEIAPVGRNVLEGALSLAFPDYEDGVLHEAARKVGADAIVTRNLKDFVNASLPVYSPEEIESALLLH